VARIRTIKPDFFYSEQVAGVSHAARLLFIGLWTIADRAGRLQWAPRKLRAQLFPYEEALLIHPLAEELTSAGLLHIYTTDGGTYAWVPGFTAHQRPHPKEPESVIPACPSDHKSGQLPWKKTAGCACIPSSPVGREGKGMDKGKGREGDDDAPPAPDDALPDDPPPAEQEAPSDPPPPPPPQVRLMPLRPASPTLDWQRRHGAHLTGYCDWVCLDEELVDEFAGRLPPSEGDREARRLTVEAWARGVRATWEHRPIGDSRWDFWRNRWQETHGTTRTVQRARPAQDDLSATIAALTAREEAR